MCLVCNVITVWCNAPSHWTSAESGGTPQPRSAVKPVRELGRIWELVKSFIFPFSLLLPLLFLFFIFIFICILSLSISLCKKYHILSDTLLFLSYLQPCLPGLSSSVVDVSWHLFPGIPLCFAFFTNRLWYNTVSGLSAAHTVYLNGGNVLLLDKQSKQNTYCPPQYDQYDQL